MDAIRLIGITAAGRHGVFAHERREGQTFVVDAVLHVDLRSAGASDALHETVNYAEVADLIESAITGAPFDLIEALAERIAVDILRRDRRITGVEVTVHKPEAPLTQRFSDVAVTLTRDRDDVPAEAPPGTGRCTETSGRAGVAVRDPDLPPEVPVRAVLALGSNLGDSAATLGAAVAALADAEGVRLLRASPLAATDPVGGPAGQPVFLNQVIEVETTRSPHGLLDLAQDVEAQHHRTREIRWGPRTLDVDVVTYAGAQIRSDRLTVPHPRAAERAFVLAPWSWMDPIALLDGVPVRELAARAADAEGVRRADHPDHPQEDPR